MGKKLTGEEFIERAKMVHEDKYVYSKVDYINSKINVVIICSKHGEFLKTPNNHLNGQGCPDCSDKLYSRKKRGYWSYKRCYEEAKKYKWLSEFLKGNRKCYSASKRNGYLKDFTWLKRHYDSNENILTARKHCIYGYFFPEHNTIYIGLTINLNRRHKKGHCKSGSVYNFCQENNLQIPEPQVIEGNLTLEESKVREEYWLLYYKSKGYNLLNKIKTGSIGTLNTFKTGNETNIFIDKARKVHRNRYDYSKVEYNRWDKKVCIVCPQHGEFFQTPNSHLMGCGCRKCGYIRLSVLQKKNTKEFITNAIDVHGDKYDYSNVEYINKNTKVIIICPIHGEFLQTPGNHIRGEQGCPKCGLLEKRKKLSIGTDKFIEKSNIIHKFKYDYSKIKYINARTHITIICPQHGEFNQIPYIHMKGSGCPKCGYKKMKQTKLKRRMVG